MGKKLGLIFSFAIYEVLNKTNSTPKLAQVSNFLKYFMIKNLQISNFKRIKKPGIELQELALVNYLVGENGCGKSSILESIEYFYILSPRNTQTQFGQNQICETLELRSDQELFETIENTSLNSDLDLNYNSKMFHPGGKIALCTNFQSSDISNKTNTFTPVLIRCDGVFDIQNQFEEFQKFISPELDDSVKSTPDHVQYRNFLARTLNTKNSINLSELCFLTSKQAKSTQAGSNHMELKVLNFLNELLDLKGGKNSENVTEVSGNNIVGQIALGIVYLHTYFKTDLFLLEEPENHLHPKWQKLLPQLFDFLALNFGFQFLITTHSPFIISSSSELTQNSKEFQHQNEIQFKPTQKVYFLKDGSVASKKGTIELDGSGRLKGRFGYWGSKCVYISSKMLGTGIMDLIGSQTAMLSPDAPRVIFCEGQGDDEDAKLYNIIFKDLKPPVLFISARGTSQLYRTFSVIREIKKGLAANFTIRMLRDRDHNFRNVSEIQSFEHANLGVRVLRRRAIECYLFSSETAHLLLKQQNKLPHSELQDISEQNSPPSSANLSVPQLIEERLATDNTNKDSVRTRDLMRKMDKLQAQIMSEAESGYLGDDYKYRLKNLFTAIVFGHSPDPHLDTLEITQDFKEQIASLITPETQTYQELFAVIFEPRTKRS